MNAIEEILVIVAGGLAWWAATWIILAAFP